MTINNDTKKIEATPKEIFLLISYYPTILVIFLIIPVPFFTSNYFNLIHLHYLHDIILHYSSLIRYLGYHQLLIHLILVILQHKILLMLHSYLTHRLCSITPDLKGLYSRILMIFPQSPTTSLILFIQLQNYLIFLVLTFLMDGSVSLLKISIASFMFDLLVPLKFDIVWYIRFNSFIFLYSFRSIDKNISFTHPSLSYVSSYHY